ncbi:MAG: hypothetical protein FWG90_05165 [Oscillospiraceae bacterium]|nr:hypothetical protein [Oscillospiraceae bacterium]
MNTKLSYRDKVIFIVIICLIVLVVGTLVIVRPKVDDMTLVRQQLDVKQAELDEVNRKIATMPDLVDTIKASAEGIRDLQVPFYEEADPYIMEQAVTDILSGRNITVMEVKTNYAMADLLFKYRVLPHHAIAYGMKMSADLFNELPEEVYREYNGERIGEPPSVFLGVTQMEFSIDAASGIEELLNCLTDIASDDKTILVTSTRCERLAKEEDKDTMNISMFSIVPLDVDRVIEDADELLRAVQQ